MSLAELLIAVQDIHRRSVLALIASVHYAKRNVFGFTFISIQVLFIIGYAIAAQHKNWSGRSEAGGSDMTETAPEEAITTKLNPSNGLQALFLSLLGQGLMYSYLRKYGFSAIGFSFLIGIVILEWGVLLRYFFEVIPCLAAPFSFPQKPTPSAFASDPLFQSMRCQNVRATYLQVCLSDSPLKHASSCPRHNNYSNRAAPTATPPPSPTSSTN
jgi:hypothetical protein